MEHAPSNPAAAPGAAPAYPSPTILPYSGIHAGILAVEADPDLTHTAAYVPTGNYGVPDTSVHPPCGYTLAVTISAAADKGGCVATWYPMRRELHVVGSPSPVRPLAAVEADAIVSEIRAAMGVAEAVTLPEGHAALVEWLAAAATARGPFWDALTEALNGWDLGHLLANVSDGDADRARREMDWIDPDDFEVNKYIIDQGLQEDVRENFDWLDPDDLDISEYISDKGLQDEVQEHFGWLNPADFAGTVRAALRAIETSVEEIESELP